MANTILHITDPGDPSAGIPSRGFEVECPFDADEMSVADLEQFKKDVGHIWGLYGDFERKAVCKYDFELVAEEEADQSTFQDQADDAYADFRRAGGYRNL